MSAVESGPTTNANTAMTDETTATNNNSSTSQSNTNATTTTTPAHTSTSLIRENNFYHKPPQEFIDDLLNAAGDYLGYGCDEYEKSLVANVIKKPQRRKDVGAALDVMYQEMDGRLRKMTPEFEAKILEILTIPSNIVLSTELHTNESTLLGMESAASSNTSSSSPSSASTSASASTSSSSTLNSDSDLLALQQRVANAALLNRALRTELSALQGDVAFYDEHEEEFPRDKKHSGKDEATLSQLESVADSVHNLRTLHTSVTEQLADVMTNEAADANQTGVDNENVTMQINITARKEAEQALQQEEPTAAAAATTATVTTTSTTPQTAASSMNISEDAAAQLF